MFIVMIGRNGILGKISTKEQQSVIGQKIMDILINLNALNALALN